MVYAGKESAVVGAVDLSLIVKEMIELLKVSASKHVGLEMNLCDDLPAVLADAAQLRQVVMNLVTNASEAIGDRDGVIHVTTRRARANQGSSGAIPDIDYVQLEVSDTGCGMSPEIQGKVFDPFFTTKIAGLRPILHDQNRRPRAGARDRRRNRSKSARENPCSERARQGHHISDIAAW
jgi:signal transduction histidine kinase